MKKYAKVALVVLLAFLLPWAATFAEDALISDESDAASDEITSVEPDGMIFSLSAEADEDSNVAISLGLENPDLVSFSDMEATVTLPEGMSLADTDGETEETIPIDPQGDGTKVTLMLNAQIDPVETTAEDEEAADEEAADEDASEDVTDEDAPEEKAEDADQTESDAVDDAVDENVDEATDTSETADATETTDPAEDLTEESVEEPVTQTGSTLPDADETILVASTTSSDDSSGTSATDTTDSSDTGSSLSTEVTSSGSNVKTGIENLSLGLMILGLAFAVVMIGIYARHHKGSSGRFLSIALALLMIGLGLPLATDVQAEDVQTEDVQEEDVQEEDVQADDSVRSVTLSTTLTVNDADYPITVTVVYSLESEDETDEEAVEDETQADEDQSENKSEDQTEDVTADTTQDEDDTQADEDQSEDKSEDQTEDVTADTTQDEDQSEDESEDKTADESDQDADDVVTEDSTDKTTDKTADTATDTTDKTDTSSDSKTASYSGEIKTATRSIAYTTDGTETVKEIIANSGVELGGYDLTDPDLDETITEDNQTITVTRIAYKTKTETESIPYGTYEYEDSSIETGKTKVKQEGVAGEKTYTYKVKYVNGVATDEKELISDEVTKEMVSEIILVGTGPVSSSSTTSSGTNSDGALLVKTSGGLGWYWPIDGNAGGCFLITSLMGTRESPGGIGSTNHQGTDIAADNGSMILAVQNGRVTQSGWNSGYGNSVTIVTTDGYTVLYGHLSACKVSVGDTVSAGQTVGLEGSTGNSTGPHLHFEVRLNGSAINGLSLYGEDIYNKLSYALDA